ncbi:MAG: CvpA family protein [Thiohalomonadaceae bacterium]
MNWVDYSILAILGISTLISIWRGFTREALSLAGWILAAWVALSFSNNMVVLLEPFIDAPSLRLIVAFAILFLLTLLVAGIINFLMVQLIQKTGLSGTDRILGIFFGIARGALVIAVLVLIAGMTPMPQDDWWRASALLHYFQDLALWIRQYLPDDIAENIRY